MNKTAKVILGIILLVVAVLLIVKGAHNKSSNSNNGEIIKIGAVLSLTGAASADGEALKQGIDFAVENLQKKGISVEVIYQDDNTDSKNTVAALNLFGAQNVDAVIGPTWSFLGDAAVPVIDRLGLNTIMPVTTTEVVNGKSKYLFHGSIKNQIMLNNFEEVIREKSIKKIAFIGNDDAWSDSILKPLESAAANTGAQVVLKEQVSFGSEASSMPSIIAKMKSLNPDIIIFSIFDDQGISKLVMSSRQQGLNVPIIATDTSLRRVINTGLITGVSLENLYDITPKSDGSFVRQYENRYGKQPNTFADRGYDAVMILVDAIQNKKDMSLSDYLHNVTNYKGYATTYNFDENGDVVGGEWDFVLIK